MLSDLGGDDPPGLCPAKRAGGGSSSGLLRGVHDGAEQLARLDVGHGEHERANGHVEGRLVEHLGDSETAALTKKLVLSRVAARGRSGAFPSELNTDRHKDACIEMVGFDRTEPRAWGPI